MASLAFYFFASTGWVYQPALMLDPQSMSTNIFQNTESESMSMAPVYAASQRRAVFKVRKLYVEISNETLVFNTFKTDEIINKALYKTVRIVHYIYWGVTYMYYNFPKNIIFCSEHRFRLRIQCRPRWNAALFGISSWSSLLVKIPIEDFTVLKKGL